MQINPAEEWQRLTEHYHEMFDEELVELAADAGNLTETAQQVLRNEMKNRGLPMPGEKTAAAKAAETAPSRFAGTVDPDAGIGESDSPEADEADGSPRDYTWKVPLCECEDRAQALALCEVLRQAGIERWYEQPGKGWGIAAPRIVVAADQLDQAREIAARPIPRELIDEYNEPVPEYEPPKCPKCGAEDPVLESAEPTNNWLCEACGAQWTDPETESDGDAGRSR